MKCRGRLNRVRVGIASALAAVTVCAFAGGALAEDMVTLGELFPELADRPSGDVPVLPAPPAGQTRTVRARDIRRALRELGLSTDGLEIPRAVRVSRAARYVEGERLRPMVLAAIRQVIHPCTVGEVRTPARLKVGAGELLITADPPRTLRDGRTSIGLSVEAGGRAQRILVGVDLACPKPVIETGQVVRIVARVGAVLASAPGRARQPGRVGEVIRVINSATDARLLGRVVDGDTVEVVR